MFQVRSIVSPKVNNFLNQENLIQSKNKFELQNEKINKNFEIILFKI